MKSGEKVLKMYYRKLKKPGIIMNLTIKRANTQKFNIKI